MQLSDMRNDVLSRLAKAGNSPAGQLPTGTGGAATIATATTLNQYLNEAAADLAQTCHAIPGSGTSTLTTGNTNVRLDSLTTSGSNEILWCARAVTLNSVLLVHCSRSYVSIYSRAGTIGTNPVYWSEYGRESISIIPAVAATGQALVVTGLVRPPAMVSDSDVPYGLDVDRCKALVFYACWQMCAKNLVDPTFASQVEMWQQMYNDEKAEMLGHLAAEDPQLAALAFSKGA